MTTTTILSVTLGQSSSRIKVNAVPEINPIAVLKKYSKNIVVSVHIGLMKQWFINIKDIATIKKVVNTIDPNKVLTHLYRWRVGQ